MNKEENYTIITNDIGDTLVYGGNSDILHICDFPSLQIKQSINDFSDSIIFVRFVNNNTFIVATYDGLICTYTLIKHRYTEINRIDIEEDITKIDFYNTNLIIGTSKGTIHIFDDDLSNDDLLQEHNTEIKEIILSNGQLFTLAENKLICYELEKMELVYEHMLNGCISMCIDDKNYFIMVSTELETLLLRDNVLIKKFDFNSECIIFLNGYFISGGAGYNLNVFNSITFENKQIRFASENIKGISKIINLQNSIIAFSTFCGVIMVGDFRNPGSFRMYDGAVGVIFDFRFYFRHILVCGTNGINVIDL